MQVKRTSVAFAAIVLCTALPAAAQSVTVEAESMALSSYVVEPGRIRVSSTTAVGTATKSFPNASGIYNIQVSVVAESDGQSTLEVYKGATLLRKYTYPLSNSTASFTISNVTVNKGDSIKLIGRPNAGSLARVDKVAFSLVSLSSTGGTTTGGTTTGGTTTGGTTTPAATAVTIEAESMALSTYTVENGNRIKLPSTTATGTATKAFPGATGTYDITAYVAAEPDGQPSLQLYKGATLLRSYTYPLVDAAATFTISNVRLTNNEVIKLIGKGAGGALARVDKLAFTPVAGTTTGGTTSGTTTGGTTTDGTTTGGTTTGGTAGGLTLPSTNTKAIATFEALGLYWTPPANPGSAGCNVQYRKAGDAAWKNALPMWYDSRNNECRGSIVYLAPGTDYQVQFSLPGKQPVAQLAARTWSESLPIARTVTVPSGSSTLAITEGGTASGYVLYTAASGGSTIDVANGKPNNVTIAAPYVFWRGFTLKGAKNDAVRLLQGAHDVVIEDNDISGWGSYSGTTTSDGQQVGTNYEAAVRAVRLTGLSRVIVQRNKIHHPRYGANSWTFGHPMGPQGIGFMESPGGNHVFRHNEIYSSAGHYFNDGMGEGENFSSVGFPHADSDIYGNIIMNCWDDAIESEGGNRNVRIWGNYMDNTMTGVATTATETGPVYIFRNVHNRSRKLSTVSTDQDSGSTFSKSGTNGSFGDGRRYVFHNTLLQASASGMTWPLGAHQGITGPGVPMTNTVSRNNILHIKKSNWSAIDAAGGGNDDMDYDLYNGNVNISGAEVHGHVGTPIYASGHGWTSESGGLYQQATNSPGYDRGVRLSNFNDNFTGGAPDIGAAETGRPAMRFGVKAAAAATSSADGAADR
ncbi:MAG: hypothetical protein ACJ8G4_11775 [Burkholderiales bacterium]